MLSGSIRAEFPEGANPFSVDSTELYAMEAFKTSLLAKQNEAQGIIAKIAKAVMVASAADQAIEGSGRGVRYVVDMSEKLKDDIVSGKIKLDRNKKGELFAQLRDENDRYGSKLSIKKELVDQGIDPLDAMNALQIQAIKQQLEDIAATLEEIGQGVVEAVQGQQNDRLGLYCSGMNLYLESRNIQDPSFRKLVAAQALRALSDANSQIALEMQADIRYLSEKQFRKKKDKVSEINRRMANITKCFEVVHRSSVLKAAVYFDVKETPAMLSTLDEYGKFLSDVIVPNEAKLREFDATDMLLQDGVWEKRAKSLMEVEGVKQRLESGTTFYLESEVIERGDEENEG